MSVCDAAANGSLDEVKRCLHDGEDIDQRNSEGQSALLAAAKGKHWDVVDYLLDEGASVEGDVFVDAAVSGNVKLVRSLLDRGVDVDSTDWLGNTALIKVVQRHDGYYGDGPVVLVRLLLESGANVDSVYTPYLIRTGIAEKGDLGYTRGDPETTALVYALQSSSRIAKMLIEAGADVNVGYYHNGEYIGAISYAQSDDEVLRMMLERGADANTKDRVGHTLLMTASFQGRVGAVKLLIDHGADVGAKRKDGATAFKLADNPDVKRLLRTSRISRLFGRSKASPV